MQPIISIGSISPKIDEFFVEDHMNVFQRDLSKDRRCDIPGQKAYSQNRSLNNGTTLVVGGHQYGMSNDLRTKVGNIITPLIAGRTNFASFEDIFELMRQNISAISGIGALALYDISLRIAWLLAQNANAAGKRAIMPRKYVYLQSGALDGALQIYGKANLLSVAQPIYDSNGRHNGGYRVEINEFKPEFQHDPVPGFIDYWDPNDSTIPAWIIEDILCVKFH